MTGRRAGSGVGYFAESPKHRAAKDDPLCDVILFIYALSLWCWWYVQDFWPGCCAACCGRPIMMLAPKLSSSQEIPVYNLLRNFSSFRTELLSSQKIPVYHLSQNFSKFYTELLSSQKILVYHVFLKIISSFNTELLLYQEIPVYHLPRNFTKFYSELLSSQEIPVFHLSRNFSKFYTGLLYSYHRNVQFTNFHGIFSSFNTLIPENSCWQPSTKKNSNFEIRAIFITGNSW